MPWREVVWALRRLEAVAWPSVVVSWPGSPASSTRCPRRPADLLKAHRRAPSGEQLVVAGADPLNVTGSIVGGTRVPTRRNQRVIFRDGVVVDDLRAGS